MHLSEHESLDTFAKPRFQEASAPDAEITPAMVEAGANVLWGHAMTENLSLGVCEDLARLVVESALQARRC